MKLIKDMLAGKLKNMTYYESCVTICGSNEVLIENITGVYECNEIMTRVKAGKNEIVVWGEELKIKNYINSSVTVCGKISSVEIQSVGVKKNESF